jgi:hypothetical protein
VVVLLLSQEGNRPELREKRTGNREDRNPFKFLRNDNLRPDTQG